MARITVEDCLAKEGNRFALIVLATERARQLAHGAGPRVVSHDGVAVVALREIAAGHVRFNEHVKDTVVAYIAERKLRSDAFHSNVHGRRGNARKITGTTA